MTTIHYTCIGKPPQIPPCGETGTTDRAAEKHVAATGHGVLTGIDPAPLARAAEKYAAACEAVGRS